MIDGLDTLYIDLTCKQHETKPAIESMVKKMAKRKQTTSPTSKPKIKKAKKEDVVIAPIVSSDEPVERQVSVGNRLF